ncbi:MAG: hypothetical protein AAF960_30180 [Bacteroidota bacterium]
MEALSPNFLEKRTFSLSIVFTTALILSHLDVVERGLQFPNNYVFPLTAFAVNSFYVAITLFLFQYLNSFLDRQLTWESDVYRRFFVQLFLSTFAYLCIQYIIIFGLEPTFNQYSNTTIRIVLTFSIGLLLVLLLNLVSLVSHFRKRTSIPSIPLTDFLDRMNMIYKIMIISKLNYVNLEILSKKN